jgi:hypothetical protein
MTKKITELDPALPLTGAEVIPLVQNVVTRRSPLSALADWVLKTYQGFLPAGVGAVATTVQGKLRESVSVKDFGADSTGISDSSTAFTNAGTEAYLATVPSGTYKLNTTPVGRFLLMGGALDFGAVGDGVADDTAAFTLAINSGAKNYSRPYWDILTKRTATDSSSVTRY